MREKTKLLLGDQKRGFVSTALALPTSAKPRVLTLLTCLLTSIQLQLQLQLQLKLKLKLKLQQLPVR
jgi:hypothetical protein